MRESHCDRNLLFQRSASEKCREKVEIYSRRLPQRNVNYVTNCCAVGRTTASLNPR